MRLLRARDRGQLASHDPCVSDDHFSPEVSRKLGWYVYRLIDPRNGETFYVGKGRGNRVFAHVRASEGLEGDDLDNKIERIRQIQLAGFEVRPRHPPTRLRSHPVGSDPTGSSSSRSSQVPCSIV